MISVDPFPKPFTYQSFNLHPGEPPYSKVIQRLQVFYRDRSRCTLAALQAFLEKIPSFLPHEPLSQAIYTQRCRGQRL